MFLVGVSTKATVSNNNTEAVGIYSLYSVYRAPIIPPHLVYPGAKLISLVGIIKIRFKKKNRFQQHMVYNHQAANSGPEGNQPQALKKGSRPQPGKW